jgi:hypothetical protein
VLRLADKYDLPAVAGAVVAFVRLRADELSLAAPLGCTTNPLRALTLLEGLPRGGGGGAAAAVREAVARGVRGRTHRAYVSSVDTMAALTRALAELPLRQLAAEPEATRLVSSRALVGLGVRGREGSGRQQRLPPFLLSSPALPCRPAGLGAGDCVQGDAQRLRGGSGLGPQRVSRAREWDRCDSKVLAEAAKLRGCVL